MNQTDDIIGRRIGWRRREIRLLEHEIRLRLAQIREHQAMIEELRTMRRDENQEGNHERAD